MRSNIGPTNALKVPKMRPHQNSIVVSVDCVTGTVSLTGILYRFHVALRKFRFFIFVLHRIWALSYIGAEV